MFEHLGASGQSDIVACKDCDHVYVAGHFDPSVNSFPKQVNLFQPRNKTKNIVLPIQKQP